MVDINIYRGGTARIDRYMSRLSGKVQECLADIAKADPNTRYLKSNELLMAGARKLESRILKSQKGKRHITLSNFTIILSDLGFMELTPDTYKNHNTALEFLNELEEKGLYYNTFQFFEAHLNKYLEFTSMQCGGNESEGRGEWAYKIKKKSDIEFEI